MNYKSDLSANFNLLFPSSLTENELHIQSSHRLLYLLLLEYRQKAIPVSLSILGRNSLEQ